MYYWGQRGKFACENDLSKNCKRLEICINCFGSFLIYFITLIRSVNFDPFFSDILYINVTFLVAKG